MLVALLLLAVACSSSKKQDKALGTCSGPVFIDDNTIQLRIEEAGSPEKIPDTMRREQSCTRAEGKIPLAFSESFPDKKNIRTEAKVYRKVYLENGGCALLVRYSAPGLKLQMETK